MKKKCAIVIPIYRSTYYKNEKIAIEQCIKVFGQHDIFFVMPNDLILEDTYQIIKVKKFPKEHFKSVNSYSRFMLMSDLYESFADYEYILVYQLDAFAFRNEIDRFCSMQYDYIGGLWPKGITYPTPIGIKTFYVGNGGFSLRKIDSFIKWTKKNKTNIETWHKYVQEDLIIAGLGASEMKLAPYEVSMQFATDRDPLVTINLNNGLLPFGCHAGEYHEFEWWRRTLSSYGYDAVRTKESDKNKNDIFDNNNLTYTWNNFLATDKEEKAQVFKCLFKKKVAIWGAGVWGAKAIAIAKQLQCTIEYFIDSSSEKENAYGFDVYLPEHLVEQLDKPIVIISIKSQNAVENIKKFLEENNVEYIYVQDIIDILYEKYGVDSELKHG